MALAIVWARVRWHYKHPHKFLYGRRLIKTLTYYKKEEEATTVLTLPIRAFDDLKDMSNDEILVKVADALRVISKRRPDRMDVNSVAQHTPDLMRKVEQRAIQLRSQHGICNCCRSDGKSKCDGSTGPGDCPARHGEMRRQ